VGISARGKYMLLGDDIVISDDKIASEYTRLISSLGVEISPTKTHKSPTMYEFAKRWYSDGKEVSGIPIKGILDIGDH